MSYNAKRVQRKHFESSKLPFAPGCSSKTRFRNHDHAKEAIQRIRYISVTESLDGSARKVPVRSYFCVNCKGWHLTSKPE